MHFTLLSPWLLLLLFPTLAAVIWLGRRARFSTLRIALYGLLAAGLVLCLAGPVRLPFRDQIPTVYLVDHSDSVADFRGELQNLQRLYGDANNTELTAWSQPQPLWLFGNNLVVNASAAGSAAAENRLENEVDRSDSRYGMALDVLCRWAADKPPGCAVLIGDGNAADLPEALAQAAELRRLGWTLDTLESPPPSFDAAVVGVATPATAAPGQALEARVRVRANAAGWTGLRLQALDRDGKAVVEEWRELEFGAAGETESGFDLRLDRPGAYRLLAQIEARSPAADAAVPGMATVDALPANNVGHQMILVQTEEISILHVVDDARPSALGIQLRHMTETLPALQWSYTTMTPRRFGALGGVPRKTRLLILDDIARDDFNLATWQAVGEYVQVEGGGLWALGGERAFGAGGHRPDEAFERCLPIRMEPPKNRRIDVVLIVDTSASMADTIVEAAVKASKLEAAKEAVWGLLGGDSLLGEDDRIALITFSDEARLRLPFTPVRDALTIKQHLATLQPEGATKPAPGVEQAFALTAGSTADKTFYVFVSDGQPSSAGPDQVDFASGQNQRIIELLKQQIDSEGKRSFWPIFVGDPQGTEPYRKTLSDFARFGHGRMIWPQSAGNLRPAPGDTTTLLEALRAILDEGNRDRFVGKKPFRIAGSGTKQALAPLLATEGLYTWRNRVGEKADAAGIWLAVEETAADGPAPGRPQPEWIGAVGRYGNGRSAAIALPMNELMIQGRKTNSRLANQLIDWVVWLAGSGEADAAWVELRAADVDTAAAVGIAPGKPCLWVTLLDPAHRAVTRLAYDLRAVPQAGQFAEAAANLPVDSLLPPLRWVAPGRFAAEWRPRTPFAALYAVQLSAIGDRGELSELGRMRLATPAAAEYLQTDLNPEALTALATAGGGELLTATHAPDRWRWRVETQWRTGRSARMARDGDDLRPWLALIVALLTILDTAVRWLQPQSSIPSSVSTGTAVDPGGVPPR